MAISEVLERQSLYASPVGVIRYATSAELTPTAGARDPKHRWWIGAQRLGRRAEDQCWIPLSWIQLAAARRRRDQSGGRIDSTGTAARADVPAAVQSGLMEWTERQVVRQLRARGDCGTRLNGVNLATPEGLLPYIRKLTSVKARIRVFVLHEQPAVAFALVVGSSGRAIAGAAAAPHERQAVVRAVAEAYGKAFGAGILSAPSETTVTASWLPVAEAEAALAAVGLGRITSAELELRRALLPDIRRRRHEHFVVDRTNSRLGRFGIAVVQVVAANLESPPGDGGGHGAALHRILA
ncbi:MAG: YcaO-like family protein [Candidatus Dormibacteria bacterium]